MFNRKMMFGGILAAAAVAPYVLNNQQLLQRVRSYFDSAQGPSSSTNSWENLLTPATPGQVGNTSPAASSSWSPWDLLGSSTSAAGTEYSPSPDDVLPAAPVIDYAEILRFDLPPEAIMQRFPRVAVVAAESGLSGMRVPIVTGAREDDVVGSLTYYFDNRRQMQRIVLQGNTGDPRRLVTLVTRQYAFQPLPSLSAGFYIVVERNLPQSLLQINYAPVIQAADPSHRVSLVLELNRPGQIMSEPGRQLVDQDRQLSHW